MEEVRPKRRKFVSAENRPSPDLVARQAAATAIAFRTLGSADAARRYLNDFDEPLNGRPIDIAGASSDGLQRVSEALTVRSAAASHPHDNQESQTLPLAAAATSAEANANAADADANSPTKAQDLTKAGRGDVGPDEGQE